MNGHGCVSRRTNERLHRHTGELLTELEEKLSKEQMELVNQFHTHVIDIHCMELEAHFQYGFSLGLMLMKEVYELLGDGYMD